MVTAQQRLLRALNKRRDQVIEELRKAGKIDSLGHATGACEKAVVPQQPAPTYSQLDLNTIVHQAVTRAVDEDRITQFLIFEQNMPPGTKIVFGTVDQIRSTAKALRRLPPFGF